MTKIIAIALASLFTAAAVVPALAESKIYFRYNSSGGSGGAATTPPEGEQVGTERFLEGMYPEFTAAAPGGGLHLGQSYFKVHGNGRFAGEGSINFVLAGFKDQPDIKVSIPGTTSVMRIPGEALGMDDGDVFLVQHSIRIAYNDNITGGTFTASIGDQSLRRNFNLDIQKFTHAPLTLSSASWPSILDFTSTTETRFDTNYVNVRGGVPPYNVSLNVNGPSSFPNDTMPPFTVENLVSVMNEEANRGADFETPNSPMNEVNIPLGPIIEANACAGEDYTVAETRVTISVTDSMGVTITSPTQTIRHTPDGPHCIRFWGLPSSY